MRIYTVEIEGKVYPAVEMDNMMFPLKGFKDVNDVIERFEEVGPACMQEGYMLSAVKILAPIPQPKQDVICLGVNYAEHFDETVNGIDFEKKAETIYFSKRVSNAPGDGDLIPHYDFVDSLDYESELGVVLGKDAKNVSKEEALSYVFGYTIVNDVSARNVQKAHQQWYRGKSLDGYTPMGPCIVTADEIPDPQNLNISCTVNGELRQSSNTKMMMQTVAGAISELSQGMTLKAGTIIATGTPKGTGMVSQNYLKSGDEVICEIEKIGKLKNIVE